MVNEQLKINRLFVDIHTTNMKTANVFKTSTRELLEKFLKPLLNQYLTELSKSKPEQLIRLEDLTLSIDVLETTSDIEIAHAFEVALRKKLGIATTLSKIEDPQLQELQLKHALRGSGIVSTTSEKSLTQAFFHFIEKGQFPWWKSVDTFFSFSELKQIKGQANFTVKLKTALTKESSRRRMIYQFDDASIAILLTSKITSEEFTILEPIDRTSIWNTVMDYYVSDNKTKLSQQIIFEIARILESSRVSKTKRIKFVEQLVNTFNQITEAKIVLEFATEKKGASPIPKSRKELATLKILKNESLAEVSVFNRLIFNKLKTNVIDNIIIFNDSGDPINNNDKSGVSLSSKPSEEIKNLFNAEEGITPTKNDALLTSEENMSLVVSNAGLLLLHPFLKTFFTNLKVLDGNAIHSEKLDLAVHLLHYLACKRLQPSEHELMFEKFICNVAIDYPIQKNLVLSQSQIEACEALLRAVLGHWSALKTKSTDVLRNEFLSRQGKLERTKDHEKVYIQRKTADILLESVPWNLGLIKFPWKKNFVFLEW